ncbi:Maph29 [Matsumuraeses phaseoli granulovirus]|uniref:Maph29 n=1 Tax=Matsumuraeses phaseoli granulovirus TaxID=2760664 RepID=A0AAE7MLI3_9BBAC|nr:Maph29 [Matsumuraeses phaseoli granulovirus]QOD39992.1 Maph29 [Matsumuraeses phaseoli granulovirus]
MSIHTVHLFDCEYDDLYKFEWPVILEYNSLCLWVDVLCLKNNGFELPSNVRIKKLREFAPTTLHHRLIVDVDNKKMITQTDQIDSDTINYEFCDVKTLQTINLEYMNENYHTVLEQFIYQHLPYYLQIHINDLKLISLFNIQDYHDMYLYLENVRKYWLFRLKIILNVNKKNCDNDKVEFGDEAECSTQNSKTVSSPNEIGFESELGVVSYEDKQELCKSLINNINIQFKHLNNYKLIDKLHVLINFNKLLKGSVGMLEVLLEW